MSEILRFKKMLIRQDRLKFEKMIDELKQLREENRVLKATITRIAVEIDYHRDSCADTCGVIETIENEVRIANENCTM